MNALSWAEEKLFVLGRLSSLVNDIRKQLLSEEVSQRRAKRAQ